MRKILSIIRNSLVWLLVIFAACMTVFTVVSLRTVDAQQRTLFGYKAFIVQSDSMSATDFDAGDVIFVKTVDPATLQAGDVIAYISRNSHNYGDTVTHKIRSLVKTESGEPGFITYGTTTGVDDETIVTHADVLGKYTGRVEGIGVFFTFMRTPKGYISIILIPFVLLILYSLFNCLRLFGQARKEHEEAREAVLMEERQKNADMRQELDQLKAMIAQLAAGKTVEVSPAEPAVSPQEPKTPPAELEKRVMAAQEKKPEAQPPATRTPAKQDVEVRLHFGPEEKKPAAKAPKPQPRKDQAPAAPRRRQTTQKPREYDELDLENIVAEFSPGRNRGR